MQHLSDRKDDRKDDRKKDRKDDRKDRKYRQRNIAANRPIG